MNRIAVALAVAALAGCNKSESASSTTAASASAAPAPPPFTGALTGERIMASKGLVHPLMNWSEAGPKLDAELGKPTFVKGTMQGWGVKEGDTCYWVKVEKRADGTVGMVQDPGKVSKNGLFMWDECLTAANVPREDAVAEDPNAPGPPTDGKPITVAALRDGASKGRTKWQKAKVSVAGLYMSTSRASSGDQKYATVTLTAAKHDLDDTISCNLADPSTAPDKLLQYATITATGEVNVADTVTGGGKRGVSVSLDQCAIKASAGK